MPERIIFSGQHQVSLESFSLPPVGPGQVHVRTLGSLISTGTEGTVYGRRFAAGTHWDNWVKYPFHPGYSLIGEVISTDDAVATLQTGQRVAVRAAHASDLVIDAQEAYPIPDAIDSKSAGWFTMAKIASMGIRAAKLKLGQSVTVIGAGPIGQMAVRWAAACGVTDVVVVDPAAERLGLAEAGGASVTIAAAAGDAKQAVWDAIPGGQGPDVVIEVTGHPAVFAAALELPRKFGRVVLLGDAGIPDDQHLTSDVIRRGLRIVGAHDNHVDASWNNPVAARHFFRLVEAGRFPLDGMITHRFKPADAKAAFDLTRERRGETMGIYFDWT